MLSLIFLVENFLKKEVISLQEYRSAGIRTRKGRPELLLTALFNAVARYFTRHVKLCGTLFNMAPFIIICARGTLFYPTRYKKPDEEHSIRLFIKGAFFRDYSGIGILGIDGIYVLLGAIPFSE